MTGVKFTSVNVTFNRNSQGDVASVRIVRWDLLLLSRVSSETYGVLFFVVPPVGPAVPLSEMVYVEPRVLRVCSARPPTTSGVGPLYLSRLACVQPA